jgi:hypothetical protein
MTVLGSVALAGTVASLAGTLVDRDAASVGVETPRKRPRSPFAPFFQTLSYKTAAQSPKRAEETAVES